jgi:hypothetical protein
VPAGAREEADGLVGVEVGPRRFPEGGDQGLEPGSRLVVGAGQRHADGQAAADPRYLAELAEDGFQDGWFQVNGYSFQQEKSGLAWVEARASQQVRDRIASEVRLDEPHLASENAEPVQPFPLVALGGGMVDLEPPDTRLGVSQGPAVVAGRADDDLADTPADSADDRAVEEPCASVEVVAHPARRGLLVGRHVSG